MEHATEKVVFLFTNSIQRGATDQGQGLEALFGCHWKEDVKQKDSEPLPCFLFSSIFYKNIFKVETRLIALKSLPGVAILSLAEQNKSPAGWCYTFDCVQWEGGRSPWHGGCL